MFSIVIGLVGFFMLVSFFLDERKGGIFIGFLLFFEKVYILVFIFGFRDFCFVLYLVGVL